MENSAQNQNDEDLKIGDMFRNCAACATIVLDAQKTVSLLSPEVTTFTGIDLKTAAGRGIDAFPDALQKFLKKALSRAEVTASEIKLPQPDGAVLKLFARATPIFGNDGAFTGLIATLSDFSCAEKLEQKLERIDRLASIGTLSASMAHEIKNALVAVKTFMDLLLSRNEEDELAGIVGREMTRIDSIVSQMLTFSGPAKPVLSPLHLHDVLNHSLRLVHHQIAKKNIRLERSFIAAPDFVKGDDYQLKQAFLNLIFNALEATPQNGTLTVVTQLTVPNAAEADALREVPPTHLRVTIRDSGTGIPPENLTRVFEPFFTTKAKGTGLGLPITKRIINEHRGTISVKNHPESGAEFSILFPLPKNGY